jgi:hypothetical protein
VAAGARLLLGAGRLLWRRIPAVSKKRINYLFRGLIVGSERISDQLNWRPSAPLQEQLRDACRADAPSYTPPWSERRDAATGSRTSDGPCAEAAHATLSPVRQSNR